MTTDGGVLDDREVADLLRRVSTIVTSTVDDGSVEPATQAAALSAVLGDVAGRLATAAPAESDRAELAALLDAGRHPAAVAVARRIMQAELARTAPPDWTLFR